MAKTSFGFKKIILFALVLRLFLAPFSYHQDVEVNYWWGKFAVDFPLRGYYDWLEFGGYTHPNQPMLYIYLYQAVRYTYLFGYNLLWWINVHIPLFPSNLMSWYFLYGNYFLEKLPFILSDLLLIYFVYLFIKKYFSTRIALLASLILAFYPPLIYNSSLWGGNESLLNLLGLLSVYLFYKNKNIFGALSFTLCLLFKSSLLIFLPVILVIFFKNKPNPKDLILTFLLPVVTTLVLAYPFATGPLLPWIINSYLKIFLPGIMPFLTANAFNFWALFFGLVPRLDEIKILPLISAYGFSTLIGTIYLVLSAIKLFNNYHLKNILLTLVKISLFSFVFLTRMHERYSYPILIPLYLLCFFDKQFIKYFIILTITHLLNVYHGWWIPPLPFLISLLKFEPTIRFISLLNLVLAVKLITINVKK